MPSPEKGLPVAMQSGEDAGDELYKECPVTCRCQPKSPRLYFDENLHGASSKTAIDSNRDDKENWSSS
jgi:hypothetical protein